MENHQRHESIINIVKTGEIPQKITALIYGQAGTGKTTFCGTAEPRFKTLIVNAEGGTLSLNKLAKERGLEGGYDTFPIQKFEDLRKVLDFLMNAKHEYKLVVFDSGTEIQKRCMQHILATTNMKGQALVPDAKGEYPPAREQAVISDWGYLNTKMTALIRSFRDLPGISFVMTALEESKESEGETRILPAFQGGIQQVIDGYFDLVCYSFTKEVDVEGTKTVKHGLCTRNTGRVRGKDRSGKLAPIVAPDFCAIFTTIFGSEEKKEETAK